MHETRLWKGLAEACGSLFLVMVGAGGCEDTMEGSTVPEASQRCVAPVAPRSTARLQLERVFDNVVLEDPVSIAHPPVDDEHWYVATKGGIVYRFDNRPDAGPSVFLDLSASVQVEGEAGLLDIAFDPDFSANGRVYASYTAPGGTAFVSRVSRFESRDGGVTAEVTTESLVIEVDQPYVNHNGGDIGFGPDGLLYIGLGDGGSAGDPAGNGQNTDTLLGSMLRIDVGDDAPYSIPPDNPFAAGGGAPEIFAWGLRNPWRWNFDRDTGQLWVGDVGQNLWEEVDIVQNGGNYGWKVREGPACLDTDTCTAQGLVDPVAEYRNTGSASVVAGFVYRGRELDGLQGTFIFNDFYFGTLFGVPATGGPVEVLGEGARGIASWAESVSGELYGVDYYDGGVYRLSQSPPPPAEPDPFPRRLSWTGCVDPSDPSRPGEGAVAYEVNLPFWSDGTQKGRFIAIPDGEAATVDEDGDLDLPNGTVVVKSFFRGQRPIETRLLVRHEDGEWAGYGYAWDEEGSEAIYVEDTRHEEIDGITWMFPSSRECLACHNAASGRSLGLEVGQLRRQIAGQGGQTIDQLDAWFERGWIPAAAIGEGLPSVAAGASIGEQARAYLHVNCSMCHREDGTGGRSNLDLRYDIALRDTGLCDANPRAGSLDLLDAKLLAPGAPQRSVILARMRAEGSARMPPLASSIRDEEGAALVEAWISELASCQD